MSETIIQLPSATLPLTGAEPIALWQNGATVQTSVGNTLIGRRTFTSITATPSGTTSIYPTNVMMGVAGSITPKVSGVIFLAVSFGATNSTTGASGGFIAQPAYGTGTAPVNGAAAAGTVTNFVKGLSVVASSPIPCAAVTVISGLTLNVPYWLDVQLSCVTGGTAFVTNINVVAFEL